MTAAKAKPVVKALIAVTAMHINSDVLTDSIERRVCSFTYKRSYDVDGHERPAEVKPHAHSIPTCLQLTRCDAAHHKLS